MSPGRHPALPHAARCDPMQDDEQACCTATPYLEAPLEQALQGVRTHGQPQTRFVRPVTRLVSKLLALGTQARPRSSCGVLRHAAILRYCYPTHHVARDALSQVGAVRGAAVLAREVAGEQVVVPAASKRGQVGGRLERRRIVHGGQRTASGGQAREAMGGSQANSAQGEALHAFA